MEDYKFLFKVVLIGKHQPETVVVVNFEFCFSILVAFLLSGEAGVGKTCLVRRFCQGTFPVGQAATIGVDFMIKNLEINNEKIKLQIWDTGKQTADDLYWPTTYNMACFDL